MRSHGILTTDRKFKHDSRFLFLRRTLASRSTQERSDFSRFCGTIPFPYPDMDFQALTKDKDMQKLAATSIATLITLTFPAAAAEPRVEKTASGIVITTLKEGTGASPKSSETVKVNYRGVLENGKEFDSSYSRGQPATFPLNRVIPCWTEGVQTMKTGGKAKLVCPPGLAYGSRGVPGTIPPDSTLVFEVELLEIVK
jgi:FKBP-type peptidyl-prolyl cis-trans isomerase FkpA